MEMNIEKNHMGYRVLNASFKGRGRENHHSIVNGIIWELLGKQGPTGSVGICVYVYGL